jgi:hypothetical protein
VKDGVDHTYFLFAFFDTLFLPVTAISFNGENVNERVVNAHFLTSSCRGLNVKRL